MFDADAWEGWMLADRNRKPSYVELLRRRVDFMSRAGVDWNRFSRGPKQAKLEVRDFLASGAKEGKVHMVRCCQKALNLIAQFLAETNRRFDGLAWPLLKTPPRRLNPYTPEEVRILAGSVAEGFKGRRQAAAVWLLANTGLRKGEVWSFRTPDLDAKRSAVLLREPEKGGEPRWVLLPRAAWLPGNPLGRYLRARARVAADTEALWVTMWGHAMSKAAFGGDMHDLRVSSGVKGNFNRFRHTRGTIFEETGTPLETAQRELGHADPKNTMHYMHGSLARRRAVLARCGVPGFEGEAVPAPPSEEWADLGLPVRISTASGPRPATRPVPDRIGPGPGRKRSLEAAQTVPAGGRIGPATRRE
jgi:integrase